MASTVLPNGIIVPEKFSRDWYADLYHNWQELDNLLGGGTPKDGTLTIQKNGDTVGTFSANQSTDETVNIEVPTATSELTNDSGFITGVSWNDVTDKPTFATVATSGSYDDLSDKPTIPTVNNATLTIQQNGTTVDTFTANSSTDKTVNIAVPTNTNELTNGAGFITSDYAIPRSGGAVLEGTEFRRTTNNEWLSIHSSSNGNGSYIALESGGSPEAGVFAIHARTSPSDDKILRGSHTGTLTWGAKNVAMAEDVIPRSGGAVISGNNLGRAVNNSYFFIEGGTSASDGGLIVLYGKNYNSPSAGGVLLSCHGSSDKTMILKPDGTWTWDGQAVQLISDQRLKQQITEIDDKLLDAWQDVELCQFKYNDAVEQKGDTARLHTGFVVQQIDSACKKHGVDISNYGLYCHEVYPEETEEVEVEQADGTKTKETRVIREASEHYSLRYTEALIVECKYLRRCVERLTARIEQLEKGNSIK